jgi:tRNA U38,U39,U40 pseudouridine synthase TruA
MMGALVDVGRGVWTTEDIRHSLIDFNGVQIKHIAPSSSLILHKVSF